MTVRRPPSRSSSHLRRPRAAADRLPQVPARVALISEGAGDLDGFHAAVDAWLAQMGDAGAAHVQVALRRATIPPLLEAGPAWAPERLRRPGLGVKDQVAVVTDPADRDRADRADAAEAVAAFLQMQVRSFQDHGAALDWLSEADRGRPGASTG